MECSPLSAFQKANPGLTPIPTPGYGCIRQVTAGGFVSDMLLHPSFTPFQYTFRRLPSAGLYTASQQHLNTIECGAFTVPKDQALAVAEYRFQLYRTSGIAGEALPLESGRLPLQIGYDINVDQMRQSNLRTEIIPTVASDRQAAFDGAGTGGFGSAMAVLQAMASNIYGSSLGVPDETPTTPNFVQTSNAGEGLLPQTQKGIQGPERWPFVFIARQNQAVQLRITAFGPLTVPISFLETTLMGYLMPTNTLQSMLEILKPCT